MVTQTVYKKSRQSVFLIWFTIRKILKIFLSILTYNIIRRIL